VVSKQKGKQVVAKKNGSIIEIPSDDDVKPTVSRASAKGKPVPGPTVKVAHRAEVGLLHGRAKASTATNVLTTIGEAFDKNSLNKREDTRTANNIQLSTITNLQRDMSDMRECERKLMDRVAEAERRADRAKSETRTLQMLVQLTSGGPAFSRSGNDFLSGPALRNTYQSRNRYNNDRDEQRRTREWHEMDDEHVDRHARANRNSRASTRDQWSSHNRQHGSTTHAYTRSYSRSYSPRSPSLHNARPLSRHRPRSPSPVRHRLASPFSSQRRSQSPQLGRPWPDQPLAPPTIAMPPSTLPVYSHHTSTLDVPATPLQPNNVLPPAVRVAGVAAPSAEASLSSSLVFSQMYPPVQAKMLPTTSAVLPLSSGLDVLAQVASSSCVG
jgi:hypothetical protein